jgi:hypothetical protein
LVRRWAIEGKVPNDKEEQGVNADEWDGSVEIRESVPYQADKEMIEEAHVGMPLAVKKTVMAPRSSPKLEPPTMICWYDESLRTDFAKMLAMLFSR